MPASQRRALEDDVRDEVPRRRPWRGCGKDDRCSRNKDTRTGSAPHGVTLVSAISARGDDARRTQRVAKESIIGREANIMSNRSQLANPTASTASMLDRASALAPSRVRYQVVGLTVLLAMVTYLDRVAISKLAPDIMADRSHGARSSQRRGASAHSRRTSRRRAARRRLALLGHAAAQPLHAGALRDVRVEQRHVLFLHHVASDVLAREARLRRDDSGLSLRTAAPGERAEADSLGTKD